MKGAMRSALGTCIMAITMLHVGAVTIYAKEARQPYDAPNGLVVRNELGGPYAFGVLAESGATAAGYWCAAYHYATKVLEIPDTDMIIRATGVVPEDLVRWRGDDDVNAPHIPPAVFFSVDQDIWSTRGPDTSQFPYSIAAVSYYGKFNVEFNITTKFGDVFGDLDWEPVPGVPIDKQSRINLTLEGAGVNCNPN